MAEFNHHFVKLNSTDFDEAPLVFYGIITIEISLYLILLLVHPFLCCAIFRTVVLHRNFRIQLFCAFFYYMLQTACRCVLLYYELNDISNSRDDTLLFWVETIRNAIMGYFCSIAWSFAFERFIATHYWSWYERASPSTLWVPLFIEMSNIIPAFTISWLLYTERITNSLTFIIFGGMLAFSVSLFIRTYLINLRMQKTISMGATINFYSVSRIFQVHENVEVMTYMSKLALPTTILSSIPITGLALKLYGPTEWHLLRNIAYTFFDLGFVIMACTSTFFAIIGNDRIYKEFKKIYPISAIYTAFISRKITQSTIANGFDYDTEIYFSQLMRSWDQISESP